MLSGFDALPLLSYFDRFVKRAKSFIQSGTGAVSRTVEDKLRDDVSLKDFAAGGGVTDDTSGVANALTRAGTSNAGLQAEGTFLVTALDNPYGVEFTGPGEVVKAITGGYQRLNTYADKHKYAIGKEYLYRAYARIANGQISAGGTLKVFVYGDSTIVGGNGESADFSVTSIIPALLAARGLGNVWLTNRGVTGTKVSDMNALPDLSATTDLFIIKYGINDGAIAAATRLATFKTELRSKLAAIRAAGNGAVNQLSIILVGPNSTSDTPNNRDERWYEQLRGIYVQAARDYQCAYFDTYAFLKDSRGAAGYWMDNPYADGRAVHPLDPMQAWIWGAVVDWAFGLGETRIYASNRIMNQGAVSDTWSSANVPSAYKLGIAIQRAQVVNGAPFEGAVVTIKNVDTPALQMLYGYAANVTRCVIRTANIGSDTWNRWSGGVVQEALTLLNGWVNFGASFGTPSAAITSDGFCALKGVIKNGTVAAGTVVATLPSGMAPAEDSLHVVATSAGYCQIKVISGGSVVLQTAGDATYTSLDGIVFKVA